MGAFSSTEVGRGVPVVNERFLGTDLSEEEEERLLVRRRED